MRSACHPGDLLLGESQLETALPQMRSHWADLAQGTNTRVFGARVAVCRVAVRAIIGSPGSTLADGAVRSGSHLSAGLITLDKFDQHHANQEARRVQGHAAACAGSRRRAAVPAIHYTAPQPRIAACAAATLAIGTR
jgi:hypothetical protein